MVQGKEIVENTSLVLPSIKFVGEGNLSLYNNQTSAIRIKLVNTNSWAVNDITILLSSELYQVLKASPEKINLEPNGEAEITLSINEGKNLEAGTYSGEIKARNSITATLPVKIEILESGQKIEKKEKDCFDLGFQCCTEIKDGTDLDAIKKATEELSTEMQKIGSEMSQAQQQTSNQSTGSSQEGNVRDAEFSENKDEEKPKEGESGENKENK